MSSIKFVDRDDLQPSKGLKSGRLDTMIAELSEHPGQWAEIDRYELERRASAYSRGSQTCRRYPVLEYAVERDGDEFVLYFRVTREASA